MDCKAWFKLRRVAHSATVAAILSLPQCITKAFAVGSPLQYRAFIYMNDLFH